MFSCLHWSQRLMYISLIANGLRENEEKNWNFLLNELIQLRVEYIGISMKYALRGFEPRSASYTSDLAIWKLIIHATNSIIHLNEFKDSRRLRQWSWTWFQSSIIGPISCCDRTRPISKLCYYTHLYFYRPVLNSTAYYWQLNRQLKRIFRIFKVQWNFTTKKDAIKLLYPPYVSWHSHRKLVYSHHHSTEKYIYIQAKSSGF